MKLQKQHRAVEIGSIDEKTRTADLVWSTGAAVTRMDFWTGRMWIEELSMDPSHVRMQRLQGGSAPLLDSHSTWGARSIMGVVERAAIESGKGTATVRFSERADVEPIWEDVRSKIIRNISVGYIVHRLKDVSAEDAKIKTLRAIDWEPIEISIVPVPADPGAGFRANENLFECEVEEFANPGAARTAEQRAIPLDVLIRLNEHRRHSLKGVR